MFWIICLVLLIWFRSSAFHVCNVMPFQVSYSLTQLAKTQLNKDRKEILPHEIPRMFQKSEFLMELVRSHTYITNCICLFRVVLILFCYFMLDYYGCHYNL